MKAIKTTYHGPTNTKGARISARDSDRNKVFIPYPHHLPAGEACHRLAAETLCKKMNWSFDSVFEELPNPIGGELDGGFVFVFIERKYSR